MRILILNWRDIRNPKGGGAEKVTHEHAKVWVKAGHEVVQFSAFFKGALPRETIDGVTIIRRGRYFTVHFWAFCYFLFGRFGKVDLIIDEFHFTPFLAPLYPGKTKVIGFIHEAAKDVWFANWPFPSALIGYLLEPFFFLFYRKVHFITVSPSTKKDLVKFGISPDKIKIIFDGIDCQVLKELPQKEKKPTICFVGHLSKDKGTEDAIVALSKIKERLPQAQFWVIGRGEKKLVKRLKNRVEELGLTEGVKFWGFVSGEKKLELMKKSHLLVNPSQREGWGLVVIEANAMGTPVVGYNVPGLRDSIKDRETGILTKENNSDYLAREAVELLEDKKLYQVLQKNALLWSKKFTWEKATKESLKLVERLVETQENLNLRV